MQSLAHKSRSLHDVLGMNHDQVAAQRLSDKNRTARKKFRQNTLRVLDDNQLDLDTVVFSDETTLRRSTSSL